MDLTGLLNVVEDSPAYGGLISELKESKGDTRVAVLEASKPYLIAALYRKLRRPMLVVTAQPENAKKLQEQVMAWRPAGAARLFPEPDALPYQRVVSDLSTEIERLQVLAALAGVNGQDGPPLVITSAPALLLKTTPHRAFAAACHTIEANMNIAPLELLQRWEAMGYRLESVVEVPGTMGRRGGIVDIYPPTSERPARLEFLGNTIESIRLFDPASQRSLQTVSSLAITPATEVLTAFRSSQDELAAIIDRIDLSGLTEDARAQFREELTLLRDKQRLHNLSFYAPLFNADSLLDYLPEDALLIIDGPQSLRQAVETLDDEARELRAQKIDAGELPANFPAPYFTWPEMASLMEEMPSLSFATWEAEQSEARHLDFTQAPSYGGQLDSFVRKTKQLKEQKKRVIIVSHQAGRLTELLNEADIFAPPVTEIKQAPVPGSVTLVQGSLAEGWVLGDHTTLLTDAEIFGFVKERRLVKRRPVAHHKLLADISPGDYVVHIEHGIGKFAGVTTMSNDSRQKEYLVLLYAAGDKLYVPTDQIDRVGRYVGAGDQPPVLSRLGTQEWARTKQRVKEAAEEVARDLLALYATREVAPGFRFSRDTVWQQEMEASFPYVETPDQMTVQAQVKADMEKPKPMDRLVCVDVGYGKTEIALRAAFKAVMDGKQVAVLVPTTVLAQQHFNTFRERLSAFPVKVEMLSRFRTPREQKAALAGLATGSVDIVIGTHRLLQKDVVLKDVGLVIIDEEQRFGVAHKEHLKQMRREVDVLTLSATPIPRSLYMALGGIRDMSTMETPPEERLPIKTYVSEFDERLTREAVVRELERGGQVYFVHNRVHNIDLIAARVQDIVPEARVD
ncbi:MAG: DEAD/DEAH box helicase, partial [Chloroflexi bacterium]|nr:DEAD/DEAH box helicase [Chloroflexota bacterium]